MQDKIHHNVKENHIRNRKIADYLFFSKINSSDERRWACPGLFRMPMSGDGRLCRIKLDQGYINAKQLLVLAQCVKDYGDGLLEITTRANLQIRGINDNNTAQLAQQLVTAGFGPKVEGGDDVRNIMVNPTAGFDKYALKNIVAFVEKLSLYLQQNYQKLSPKFSIFIDGGEGCAVIDHKSDIWLSLCDNSKNFAFGLNSCPTTPASLTTTIGKVPYQQGHKLIYTLIELLLGVQQNTPHVTRMKHLLEIKKTQHIIEALKQSALDIKAGDNFCRNQPITDYLGIHATKNDNRYYLGVKPPWARLTKQMLILLTKILKQYPDNNGLYFTPWQSIIFSNCTLKEAQTIAQQLSKLGFVIDKNDIRGKITTCVGAPKCAKGLSNSLYDAKILAQFLKNVDCDKIHLTACTKSCASNQIYPITLLAKKNSLYDIYQNDTPKSKTLFGTLIGENLNIEQAANLIRKTSQ